MVTYHTFPMGKNKIMVRFENMADRFDSDLTVQQLDLDKFANTFYQSANPGSIVGSYNSTFKEVSLTANQLKSDLDAKKAKEPWIGEDDGKM